VAEWPAEAFGDQIASDSLGGCHSTVSYDRAMRKALDHGTLMAGVIAAKHGTATLNGESAAGVAPAFGIPMTGRGSLFVS